MGGYPTYVPSSVMDEFGNKPHMQEYLKIYHGLRKHGGDKPNAELIYLFALIETQDQRINEMEKEMQDREGYTTNLERRLAELADSREELINKSIDDGTSDGEDY